MSERCSYMHDVNGGIRVRCPLGVGHTGPHPSAIGNGGRAISKYKAATRNASSTKREGQAMKDFLRFAFFIESRDRARVFAALGWLVGIYFAIQLLAGCAGQNP